MNVNINININVHIRISSEGRPVRLGGDLTRRKRRDSDSDSGEKG